MLAREPPRFPDVTSSRHLQQFPRFSRTVLGTAVCRWIEAVLSERDPLRGTHPGGPEGVQRQVLNVSAREATAEVSTIEGVPGVRG